MKPERKLTATRRLSKVLGAALFASSLLHAGPPPLPQRGDADRDGKIVLTDAVFILGFLFQAGTAPPCQAIADVDADGAINLTDPIVLLGHLFQGAAAPPPLSAEEVAACQSAIERGQRVYSERDAEGNRFACATCHASVPDAQSPIRYPGHDLHDALRRPSFKLGQVPTFLGAANVCRVDWMKTTAWQETDAAFLDLVAFLESVSPSGPAPALVYEIVQPVINNPAGGDPQAGCELYHRSCIVCHGPGAQGTDLAPSLVSFLQPANSIRRKVRLSGPRDTVYPGLTGGVMPFWSKDKLSDQEIENLVAFLRERPVRTCEGQGAGP